MRIPPEEAEEKPESEEDMHEQEDESQAGEENPDEQRRKDPHSSSSRRDARPFSAVVHRTFTKIGPLCAVRPLGSRVISISILTHRSDPKFDRGTRISRVVEVSA